MTKPILKIDKKQVVSLLMQFKENEIQNIIDDLLKQKLYNPPKFNDISEQVKKIVKKENLNTEIINEAVVWARQQK
jgi:hypothetical protein